MHRGRPRLRGFPLSLSGAIWIGLGGVVGCAGLAPCAAADPIVVEAIPEFGFHYPYLLLPPSDSLSTRPDFLVVEPNNTGGVSDSLPKHMEGAKRLIQTAIGGYVAKSLELPLLVPVFPRPETDWVIYTHALDRDAMLVRDGPMRRLDLQLIAMVDDARSRLAEMGYELDERFLITGFSASGTFANRFVFLHPRRVRAVASGGVNGILMLPVTESKGVELRYPLGLADFEAVSGREFDLETWRAVPQLIYMGAEDENDAVQFDDGYSDDERAAVYEVIGERMQPDRWVRCQEIYLDFEANVTFRTFEGVGHGTDRRINEEIVEFFREAITPRAESRTEP